MIVMKFGGTSVEDATAIDRSCGIVAERIGRKPFVVVSALAGTTNGLLEAARLAAAGELDRALSTIATLEQRHIALLPDTATDFAALRDVLRSIGNSPELTPRLRDQVASFGEIMSSRIFADRMRQHGHRTVHVDARDIMITDGNFGKAAPLEALVAERFRDHVRPHLEAGTVVIMGGFIGSTTNGETTTLGRGASDYSAAIAGAAMDVEEIQIWTDVDGMMTTDPRIVADAWKVKNISFSEASELAYFGAKVLFPLSVVPAIEKNIPVLILNSRKPAGTGTRITREAQKCSNPIKSIAMKRGITVVTVTSSRMLMAYGFLRSLFEVFDRRRTSVDMIATSEVSVSLTLDDTSALPAIIPDLEAFGEVTVDQNRTLICLVGANLKYTPGIASRIFSSIRDINVLMISHGASTINMSFLVDGQDADTAVRNLHAEFFQNLDPEVFEPPHR
ncbi:MAG TPA: lysine-sensitive aspartokinase 3 [Terriglobia bacterium]|nr:lysine-sensitive aspartokinase 3 [Terriglobia bacterium]